MAGHLRIHAQVVERACHNCRDDRPRSGTARRRRAVIAALAGGDRSDDKPYHQDKRSETHIYSPKIVSSRGWEKRRAQIVTSSTRDPDAYSAARDTSFILAAGVPLRCIVCADGPGWRDRPGGTSTEHPSAGLPAGWRRVAAAYQSFTPRSDVVLLHH